MSKITRMKIFRRGLVVAALSAVLLGSTPAAYAGFGGGSVGGGGVGGAATHFGLVTEDNVDVISNGSEPVQGWGQASIDRFIWLAYHQPNLPFRDQNIAGHNAAKIQTACNGALAKALETTPGSTKARVVQVGMGLGQYSAPWGDFTYYIGGAAASMLHSSYNQYADAQNPYLVGYSDAMRGKVNEVFRSNIVNNAHVVCVAIADNDPVFPKPPPPPAKTFDLGVNTDKKSVNVRAGGWEGVSDTIHIWGWPTDADVRGFVGHIWLNIMTPNGGVSAKKMFHFDQLGDVDSPVFYPSDYGFDAWPAGNYWFDVGIYTGQGNLAHDAIAPLHDPRESWTAAVPSCREGGCSKEIYHRGVPGVDVPLGDNVLVSGQPYNTRLKLNTVGAAEFWMIDKIKTDQVFIGASDRDITDEIRLYFPNGSQVPAIYYDVAIDRSVAGEVTVIVHMKRTTRADGQTLWWTGDWAVWFPTYVLPTKTNYDVTDTFTICRDSRDRCEEADSRTAHKVTPPNDKVWSATPEGALEYGDPNHTNAADDDGKTFIPGMPVSAAINTTVPAKIDHAVSEYVITDDWSDAVQYVDFSNVGLTHVYDNGVDVTSKFVIEADGTRGVTTVKAKPEFLDTMLGRANPGTIRVVVSGSFRSGYTAAPGTKMVNKGSVRINNETVPTNEPPIFTVSPKPDKTWTLDEKGSLVTADPTWTNNTGADNTVFLPGDGVGAVVNDTIPANMVAALTNYVMVDDWSNGTEYLDFSDISKTKVFADGKDVTNQFIITVKDGVTTATANADFLSATKGMTESIEMKLGLLGNFKKDYRTKGDVKTILNKGHVLWNNEKVATNTPPIYTWTDAPHKHILGDVRQGGDQSDINGKAVYPSQLVEYKIDVDMNIPDQAFAYGIKSFGVRDSYDPQFEPDKDSLEFFDSRNNTVIQRSAYTITWDDTTYSWKAMFTPEWIKANVARNNKGWLSARFRGKIKGDTEMAAVISNQAFQIVNDFESETEIPQVNVPSVQPHKEDLSTDMVDINDRLLIMGDHLIYRLTLDAGVGRDKLAYNVHKLGMVDDYDEGYLDITEKSIKVLDDAGVDVTDKFNVQVKDGKFAVFFKHVTFVNNRGEKVVAKQPDDLFAYNDAAIEPVSDGIIDQTVLGKKYSIIVEAVVTKEEDGYVIKNQAVQNIENLKLKTEIVSNPLKKIDPTKDIVVDESSKDASINGTTIKLNDMFNYRLNSSPIPAGRVYNATQWSIEDKFDGVHDRYMGIWAVYANSDLYDGQKKVFSKGALITDSAGHAAEAYKDMFKVTWDPKTLVFKIEAQKDYLDLVNTRGDLSQSWSVYTKMERIAPSEKIINVFDESYNNTIRHSNEVVTNTPEHPSLTLVKYNVDEGPEAGDHDDFKDVLQLAKDSVTEIGFDIVNNGDVPVVDVVLTDEVTMGTGTVTDIFCTVKITESEKKVLAAGAGDTPIPDTKLVTPDAIGTMLPGDKVTCVGRLTGMVAGTLHTDVGTVVGKSIHTGKEIKADDAWSAVAPAPAGAITGAVMSRSNTILILVGSALLGCAAYAVFRRKN